MKTVLVVDDEAKIVQIARDYLEHAGFAVLSAADGEAALAVARSARPDLVVLDLGLPGMDGLDVCRALRKESDTPVIMLTAKTQAAEQKTGKDAGAADYINKPFTPKDLVAQVREFLGE